MDLMRVRDNVGDKVTGNSEEEPTPSRSYSVPSHGRCADACVTDAQPSYEAESSHNEREQQDPKGLGFPNVL